LSFNFIKSLVFFLKNSIPANSDTEMQAIIMNSAGPSKGWKLSAFVVMGVSFWADEVAGCNEVPLGNVKGGS
jgi:hypothetical protein